MSKHKTRQQKIIADLHRKLQSHQSSLQEEKPSSVQRVSSTHHYTYSLQKPLLSSEHKETLTIPISYIKHDLYKTLLVTTTIVITQLVLFYLLKTHIIILPLVRY